MSVANIYKKLKQILNDSNTVLAGRELNEVGCFSEVLFEIEKLGSINRLPYLLRGEIIEVTIEDFGNATSIENFYFYECANIEKIAIPSHINSIGIRAFSNCINLKDMYLHSMTPPALGSDVFKKIPKFHVPIGSGEAYKSATNWSRYAGSIVEDIEIE